MTVLQLLVLGVVGGVAGGLALPLAQLGQLRHRGLGDGPGGERARVRGGGRVRVHQRGGRPRPRQEAVRLQQGVDGGSGLIHPDNENIVMKSWPVLGASCQLRTVEKVVREAFDKPLF